MKYLNKYNKFNESKEDESVFDDVKDVFQDLIDEYDLVKLPQDGLLPYGLSYTTKFFPKYLDGKNYCYYQIEIYVNDIFNRPSSNDRNKYLTIFYQKMIDDLKNFCQRLEAMGFYFNTSNFNRYQRDSISSSNTGPFKIIIRK